MEPEVILKIIRTVLRSEIGKLFRKFRHADLLCCVVEQVLGDFVLVGEAVVILLKGKNAVQYKSGKNLVQAALGIAANALSEEVAVINQLCIITDRAQLSAQKSFKTSASSQEQSETHFIVKGSQRICMLSQQQ